MGLQIGRIDHDGPGIGIGCGQTFHHSDEDTRFAPTLLTVVQRFRRPIVLWRIPPSQTVAVDEDDAAENPPVIDTWPAVALGKERTKPLHLLVRQPVQIAHIQSPRTEPESDGTP